MQIFLFRILIDIKSRVNKWIQEMYNNITQYATIL